MSEKKFPPPSEADPCPCPLPQPNRRADDFQADLVEGDEGGGSSGLGNKERRSGHRSL
jgi:hypothetical protein